LSDPNYQCDENGQCPCKGNYYGQKCDISCELCHAEGTASCSNEEHELCNCITENYPFYYGETCEKNCDHCDEHGTDSCSFETEKCNCKSSTYPFYYGENCESNCDHCDAAGTKSCDEGKCECNSGFHGDNCDKYPVNCVWGSWSGWGQCSKTCGSGGKETRTRSKTVVEANGGTCSGSSTQQRSCVSSVWPTCPQVQREGSKCYDDCAKLGGYCHYCGSGGLCCKMGAQYAYGPCSGNTGWADKWRCIKNPGLATGDVAKVNNGNKKCFDACGKKMGPCNFCGPDGLCCKKGYAGNGCDGKIGKTDKYRCIWKGMLDYV